MRGVSFCLLPGRTSDDSNTSICLSVHPSIHTYTNTQPHAFCFSRLCGCLSSYNFFRMGKQLVTDPKQTEEEKNKKKKNTSTNTKDRVLLDTITYRRT